MLLVYPRLNWVNSKVDCETLVHIPHVLTMGGRLSSCLTRCRGRLRDCCGSVVSRLRCCKTVPVESKDEEEPEFDDIQKDDSLTVVKDGASVHIKRNSLNPVTDDKNEKSDTNVHRNSRLEVESD